MWKVILAEQKQNQILLFKKKLSNSKVWDIGLSLAFSPYKKIPCIENVQDHRKHTCTSAGFLNTHETKPQMCILGAHWPPDPSLVSPFAWLNSIPWWVCTSWMMDTWLLCIAVNSTMQMPLTSDLHPAMEVTAAENKKAKPQMHSKPVTCPRCPPWER